MAAPLVVALAACTLFGLTASDAVQVADSAELVTVACELGVAHPPGYPLYTLLGHGFCQLPWSTPAGRLSLLSLVAGVLAALLLYAAARRLRCPPWVAALAALTMCTSSGLWRMASCPETRTLHVALCLALVYAGLRLGQAPSRRGRLAWSAALGLAGGLCLCSHHSAVALGPFAGAALIWAGPRVAPRPLLGRLLVALAGLAVGLLPYLHLLLADPQQLPRWGETQTWPGFVHHLLRADYGTLSLSIKGEAARLANLRYYLAQVPAQLGWIWWAPATAGLALLLVPPLARRIGGVSGTPPASRVALGLGVLLAGPALLLLFDVPPEGAGAQVVSRFHVLPNALLCLGLAVALAAVDRRWLGQQPAGRRRAWQAVAFGVTGLGALLAYPRADLSQSYAVEDYAHNVLVTAAPGALVLGAGDVGLFATTHAQRLHGLRRDVQYVNPWMLLYPWYVAQQRRAHPGFGYHFRKGSVDTIGLIRAEMARGRTVYLTEAHSQRVARAFSAVPEGPLLRLIPPGATPPSTAALIARNRALRPRLSRRGRAPDPAVDPWSASLWETHARPWDSLARAAEAGGHRALAADLRRLGQRWAPWRNGPAH